MKFFDWFYDNYIWRLRTEFNDYFNDDGYLFIRGFDEYENAKDFLNDEVEIIEEDKKIEKLELYEDSDGHYFYDKHCKKIYITCDEINFMFEQFNELIEEIEKLKEVIINEIYSYK